MLADALARFGLTLDFHSKIFDHPPNFIINILRADCSGAWFLRGF